MVTKVIDFSTYVNRDFYLAPACAAAHAFRAMDLRDRIRQRLDETGMTARSVSMSASKNPNLIGDILKGNSQSPRLSTISKLADALGVDAWYLIEGEIGAPGSISAPLLSMVSAGQLTAVDYIPEMDEARRVSAPDLDPSGDWIALRVEGDSMDRISPPESIIFVDRRDRALVPNACYVFGDGEGGATYKRWRPDPNRLEPVSTNAAHEPLFVPHGREPSVIGRVRRSVLEM